MSAVPVIDNSPITMGNVSGMECLCGNCGISYTLEELRDQAGTVYLNGTPDCLYGGPLDIRYDMDRVAEILTPDEVKRRYFERPNFWLLKELLPVNDIMVDPCRPFTPLLKSTVIGPSLGIDLYLKLDTYNPTGSFKDRPTTMAFNKALEDGGYNEVYVASTGNLAISTAYFASQNGIACKVFVPKVLSERKKSVIRHYLDIATPISGTNELIDFEGNYDGANMYSLQLANEINDKALAEHGKRSTFIPNSIFRAYYKEGSKSSGTESMLQLLHGYNLSPDRDVKIIYPGGSGALACSSMKGIRELKQLGIFNNPVSLFMAQPENCAPIVNAIHQAQELSQSQPYQDIRDDVRVQPVKVMEDTTLATSIAIGDPGSGYQTVDVAIESNGGGFKISEQEIFERVLELQAKENVFAQFVGGVTLAATYHGRESGAFKENDVVVVNITGTGRQRIEDDLRKHGTIYHLEKEVETVLQLETTLQLKGL